MRLKNVLITVSDTERAAAFYRELFGLQVILRREGNVMMTEGLVLQERSLWEESLGKKCIPHHLAGELYFEESDMEHLAEKILQSGYESLIVTPLNETDGRKMMRICDPDGNLIEIASSGR